MDSISVRPYYERNGIAIYHGDCREVLATLESGSADLVLTDPPYSSGARRDADRQVRGSMLREFEDADWFSHDTMTNWGFTWFLRGLFVDLRRVLVGGAHVYVFSDWRQTPNVYGLLESSGYRVNHCLVWDKEHYGMGAYWRNQHEHIIFGSYGSPRPMRNRGMGSVLRFRAVAPERRIHPTEKPLPLLKRFLAAAPCETVIDPLMGCGSTLRAAADLSMHAIGIEIEERYCEIAARRLAQDVLPFDVSAEVAV